MGAALLGGVLGLAPEAQAGYILTVAEGGSNVVATGAGSLDIDALTSVGILGAGADDINPSAGLIEVGSSLSAGSAYSGITGPVSFGPGGLTAADSDSGPVVSVSGGDTFPEPILAVPEGYVSDTSLSASTATWDNATFTSLGITPGTYVWNWGSGATADSFTLDIVAPASVPEPASLTLLGAGVIGLILHVVFRRRPGSAVKAT